MRFVVREGRGGGQHPLGEHASGGLQRHGQVAAPDGGNAAFPGLPGTFSRVEDVETANNHRANGQLDVWLTRRLFLVTPLPSTCVIPSRTSPTG